MWQLLPRSGSNTLSLIWSGSCRPTARHEESIHFWSRTGSQLFISATLVMDIYTSYISGIVWTWVPRDHPDTEAYCQLSATCWNELPIAYRAHIHYVVSVKIRQVSLYNKVLRRNSMIRLFSCVSFVADQILPECFADVNKRNSRCFIVANILPLLQFQPITTSDFTSQYIIWRVAFRTCFLLSFFPHS